MSLQHIIAVMLQQEREEDTPAIQECEEGRDMEDYLRDHPLYTEDQSDRLYARCA